MKNDRKEELLTRWMDDGLTDEELKELEPILVSSPELQEERARFHALRKKLRDSIPCEVEPPFPDYFNSHLEKILKAEEEAPAQKKPPSAFAEFNRLWLWWMAPAVTAAVVFAFLLGMKSAQSGNALSEVVDTAAGSEVYSPLTNVSTEVIVDRDSNSTLLVVEGLAPLSDTDFTIGEGPSAGHHGFYVNVRTAY